MITKMGELGINSDILAFLETHQIFKLRIREGNLVRSGFLYGKYVQDLDLKYGVHLSRGAFRLQGGSR